MASAADAKYQAEGYGGEEQRRATSRDEGEGLSCLGYYVHLHEDVQERLACYEHAQAQGHKSWEHCRAATKYLYRAEEYP